MSMVQEEVRQFDIFWVNLDPTEGHEIKKKRPCLVISPNEMNKYLDTVIIAPITSKIKHHYPTRVNFILEEKDAQIILDQIRTVDKLRLGKKMSKLTGKTTEKTLSILCEMFAF